MKKLTLEGFVNTKFYTIYKITNKNTGKFYIGRHITTNLNDDYMGSGKYIRRAVEKYGANSFLKEYLFIFDNEEEMYNKEAEIVTEEFCLREDTYNIAPGGFAGGFRHINQNVMTPEFRSYLGSIGGFSKFTAEQRSYYSSLGYAGKTEEQKKQFAKAGSKVSPKTLGKKFSDETKRKMSDSQSGSKNSQYGLQWITNGLENKKIKKEEPLPDGWHKGRKLKDRFSKPKR